MIGEGVFGKVYRGQCRSVDVAVKVPNKQRFDQKQLAAFQHEVQIMSKIFHPNVCLFMGACLAPGNVRIVTELMKGDLERLLLSSTPLSFSSRMKMAKDAAQGMAWLHGNDPPVYHRDLKAANLLYDDNHRIKVCDFGLSETKPNGRELYDRQPKGTPLYMAPEVMKSEKITEKVDVYSFGIVLWEIYTRKEAYTEFEDYDRFYRSVVTEHYRPQMPEETPAPLAALISSCWAADPQNRPSFSRVVELLEEIRVAAIQREQEETIEKALESDPIVAGLWKQHFLHEPSVPFVDFARVFYRHIGVTLPLDKPLPEDPSLDEIRSASLDQLEQYAQRSDECRELADEEKARRSASASAESATLVPKGYENESPQPSSSTNDSASSTYSRQQDIIDDHETRLFYCLKALVANENDQVDLPQLDKTLACFGPADSDILARIHDLMKEPYFHGFLPTRDAEQMIRTKSRGTFLLRFSNNRPRSFCISKVSVDRIVRHIIITRDAAGWSLDGEAYPSVQELIAANQVQHKLEHHCPESRYSWLFDNEAAGIGGYFR